MPKKGLERSFNKQTSDSNICATFPWWNKWEIFYSLDWKQDLDCVFLIRQHRIKHDSKSKINSVQKWKEILKIK